MQYDTIYPSNSQDTSEVLRNEEENSSAAKILEISL